MLNRETLHFNFISDAARTFSLHYCCFIGRERCLSQFVPKFAMEINIRDWTRDDLSQIQRAWLAYCRNQARADMHIKPDCEITMTRWLSERFRQPFSIGFIAERGTAAVGFLVGRIDEWDSIPPVIEIRRIGIIDAVYVNDAFRRQGIGRRLIDRAIQTMRDANVIAVETIYDAWNDPATKTWRGAGFAPWMVHAYRML